MRDGRILIIVLCIGGLLATLWRCWLHRPTW